MNCYFHYERPAVAKCEYCGKFLCPECISNSAVVRCKNCMNLFVQQEKEQQKKHIRTSTRVFVCMMLLCLFLYIAGNIEAMLGMFLNSMFIAGIPYGWRKLNSSRWKGIVVLPIIGWIIYFVVKFQLAYLIGWIYFIKDIKSYMKSKKESL